MSALTTTQTFEWRRFSAAVGRKFMDLDPGANAPGDHRIDYNLIEATVLDAIRKEILRPNAIKAFTDELGKALAWQRRDVPARRKAAMKRRISAKREIDWMLALIGCGEASEYPTPLLNRMNELYAILDGSGARRARKGDFGHNPAAKCRATLRNPPPYVPGIRNCRKRGYILRGARTGSRACRRHNRSPRSNGLSGCGNRD